MKPEQFCVRYQHAQIGMRIRPPCKRIMKITITEHQGSALYSDSPQNIDIHIFGNRPIRKEDLTSVPKQIKK